MSQTLRNLDANSLGKPDLATEIPVWVAYFVEWLDASADPADLPPAEARVAALKARLKNERNAEKAFWRLKAALAPAGPLRVACRQLAQGNAASEAELRALEQSETHPLRWSLLSTRPESIVECLTYSEGSSTMPSDLDAYLSNRAAARRVAVDQFFDRTEAADSDV